MHAAQDILAVPDLSFDQRDVMLAGNIIDVAEHLETAVGCRQVSGSFLYDVLLVHPQVILQLPDRDEFHIILFGQLPQRRRPHHRPVFGHDLAADAALRHARQPQQVDCRLRVAVPHEHAAVTGDQRENMARPSQVSGFRGCVRAFHHRQGALVRGNARRCVDVVHRYGECRVVVVRVLRDHGRESQPVRHFRAHRRADQALGVRRHEIDVLLRRELGRADHVALVLAVGVVRDKDDLSFSELFDGLFDRVVLVTLYSIHFRSLLCSLC